MHQYLENEFLLKDLFKLRNVRNIFQNTEYKFRAYPIKLDTHDGWV